MHRTPTLATACCLLLLAACATAPSTDAPPVEPAACGSIKPLHRVGEIYLAGQPSPDDFALLKGLGIRTVLDIRHDRETPDFDEQRLVNELGISYISIPWNGADELDDATFAAMRRALREAERPILFHCGSSNRVGAGWLAYRVLDQGVPTDQALAEARRVGLRTQAYEAKALAYIARELER